MASFGDLGALPAQGMDPSTSAGPEPQTQFTIGEKVLVPHTDKHYEAKILKSEFRADGLWYYFLHYTGWNKKYDEWVEEAGLVKHSPDLVVAQGGMGAAPGAGAAAAAAAAAAAGTIKGKKPSLTKDKFTVKKRPLGEFGPEGTVHLDVEMPALLKKQLLEDYEAIVEDGKLMPLPRAPTVDEMLRRYVAEAQETRGSSENEEEVAQGLRSYFDKALEAVLLYRTERPQAAEWLQGGRLASSVYGAEHLLRLFVRLPDLLGVTAPSEEQVAQVSVMVQDVMHWMLDHANWLFLPKDRYIAGEVVGAV